MFKVGDEIVCINNTYREDLIFGKTYIVQEIDDGCGCVMIKLLKGVGYLAQERFELVYKSVLYPTLRCGYEKF